MGMTDLGAVGVGVGEADLLGGDLLWRRGLRRLLPTAAGGTRSQSPVAHLDQLWEELMLLSRCLDDAGHLSSDPSPTGGSS